jgi:hypothetical protein
MEPRVSDYWDKIFNRKYTVLKVTQHLYKSIRGYIELLLFNNA